MKYSEIEKPTHRHGEDTSPKPIAPHPLLADQWSVIFLLSQIAGIEFKPTFPHSGEFPTRVTFSNFETDAPIGLNFGYGSNIHGLIFQQDTSSAPHHDIPSGGEGELFHLLPFHSVLIHELVKTLEKRALASVMKLAPEDFDEYSKMLEKLGIYITCKIHKGLPVLLFTTIAGDPNPQKVAGFENCIGFFFSTEDEERRMQSGRCQLSPFKKSSINPPNIFLRYSQFIWSEFVDSMAKQIPPRFTTAPFSKEEDQYKEQLIEQIISFLNTHLAPQEITAISAKKHLPYSEFHMKNASTFPLVDILFIKKQQDGSVQLMRPTLLGWEAPRKKSLSFEEVTETCAYESVIGLTIVPDGEELAARKQLNRGALPQIRRYFTLQPSDMCMSVDNRLLQLWQTNRTPFPTRDQVFQLETAPLERQADYGFNIWRKTPITEVSLHTYEPGGTSHIGGTQLTLRLAYQNPTYPDKHVYRSLLLDSGYIFDLVPSWGSMGNAPTWEDGVLPLLRNQMFDTTLRLYRLDLLVNSLRPDVIETVYAKRNNPAQVGFTTPDEYILLELFHRLGEDGLTKKIAERMPTYYIKMKKGNKLLYLMRYLQQRHQIIYSTKSLVDGLILTHGHQDHTVGSGIMRDDLVRIATAETRALMLADHRISSQWWVADSWDRKQREAGLVGSQYNVVHRPFYIPKIGVREEIAPNVFMTAFEMYHSIPGCIGVLLEIEQGGNIIASFAYPGDYRTGDFFEWLGDLHSTGSLEKPVQLLFIEGTNPENVKKDSAHYTEKDVAANIEQVIAEANQSNNGVIIDLIKNNFERLLNICEMARRQNRIVVLSSKIIDRCEFVQFLTSGKRILMPDLYAPWIKVWQPRKQKFLPHQHGQFERYGFITEDQISTHPERYVLVRDSNESVEQLAGLAGQMIYCLSKYNPYDETARQYQRHLTQFAADKGWQIHVKGFHATGHGTLVSANHPNADHGIVQSIGRANAQEIVIGHTQQRGAVHEILRTYAAFENTKIHSQLRHPRHKITLYRS